MLDEVREEVLLLASQQIYPALAVLLVGDDPASHVYVRNKLLRAKDVGIRSWNTGCRRMPARRRCWTCLPS